MRLAVLLPLLLVLNILLGCQVPTTTTKAPVTTFQVVYDGNSGGGKVPTDTQNYSSGSLVTVLGGDQLTRAGYVFTSWNTKPDGTGTNYASGSTFVITAKVTLFAQWTLLASTTTYVVTFDSRGGSSVGSVTLASPGGLLTKPADPTRTGYLFSGWYREATLTTLWVFSTDKATSDLTLYARWTLHSTSTVVSVSFDSQGGSSVATVSGLSPGSLVTKPNDPTRTGFTFAGWYKDASLATPWVFSSDKVSISLTLYAKWVGGTGATTIGVQNNLFLAFSATPPTSLAQGSSVTLQVGSPLTLSASASYRWYIDGTLDAAQVASLWTGGANLVLGPHSVMVVVMDQGALGSITAYFQVK